MSLVIGALVWIGTKSFCLGVAAGLLVYIFYEGKEE